MQKDAASLVLENVVVDDDHGDLEAKGAGAFGGHGCWGDAARAAPMRLA
mgnify:CR=1 FL=1